jgi:hypothetical protein
MATDGVKIVDGDTAHDTYCAIMDLYDSGATSETIRMKIPFPQADYYDEFDYELYTTAYALAMWEIGFISSDIIKEVKNVIEKGACVKVWTEEYGAKMGKRRQKELDKLWGKITSENIKIRKRKKYKLIDKFLYNINDVLSFQLADTNYYVIVLLDVTQYRGECDYRFGKILYKSKSVPTMSDMENCEILGRKIPSTVGMDSTKIFSMSLEEMQKEGGFEEVLRRQAKCYDIGMSMIAIDHRKLVNFTHKFIKVGNLNLKEVCKQMGSLRVASTFEELVGFDDHDFYLKIFPKGTFKIRELLNE